MIFSRNRDNPSFLRDKLNLNSAIIGIWVVIAKFAATYMAICLSHAQFFLNIVLMSLTDSQENIKF